jgi:acetylglutamate/LysW-gamma-L-alpha-aminoadipate kinase
LNVDGDRAAAALACAIGASTLVILTNVPGLLRDPEDPDSLVEYLGTHELDSAEEYSQGRMRKKVLGAREALEGGVTRVILADARRAAPITSALAGRGTVLGAPLEVTA